MEKTKCDFIFSLIPSGVPLIRDASSVLTFTPSDSGDEVVVLDVEPTAVVLDKLQRQRRLPPGVRFAATVHEEVDKIGIPTRRPVLAVCVKAAPFRAASPYTFWFAAYPRAMALYAVAILVLGGVWLLLH